MVVSSHLVNWAASRIVNGLTRTVTEMEEAPSEPIVVVYFVTCGVNRRISKQRKAGEKVVEESK